MVDEAWRQEWDGSNPVPLNVIFDPTVRPHGFDLPRKLLPGLNHIRRNHGRFNFWKHKWRRIDSLDYDCENPQTRHHNALDCSTRKFPSKNWRETLRVGWRVWTYNHENYSYTADILSKYGLLLNLN